MRVVTIKHPPVVIEGLRADSFHLGDVYDVSPHLGIYLTAAGWVRSETRKEVRRADVLPPPAAPDRRALADRRH